MSDDIRAIYESRLEVRSVKDIAEIERLRVDNATLRQALKGNADPVAWMVKAKHGLIRACWSEQPSDEQIAVAIADGDTITPLYTSPSIPEGWVMVPNIANDTMLDAMYRVARIANEHGTDPYVDNEQDVWEAMIAAAPKPE